jgi:hypothetical protein
MILFVLFPIQLEGFRSIWHLLTDLVIYLDYLIFLDYIWFLDLELD